jgi:hypothetical protein
MMYLHPAKGGGGMKMERLNIQNPKDLKVKLDAKAERVRLRAATFAPYWSGNSKMRPIGGKEITMMT